MDHQIELRQQALNALYKRDTQKICCSYSYFARYLAECVYDRFGILDEVPYSFNFPVYTSLGVIEASKKRAHELGPSPIAWSGGVDSSFLVSLFVAERIPVEVVYNDMAVATSRDFLKVLQKESAQNKKVVLHEVSSLEAFKNTDRLVTGDVVDTLLFPSPLGMQNHFNGKYEDALIRRYGISDGERLIGVINDYGKLFDKPVVTEDDVVRLFSWSCLYYPHREAFYHMIGGNESLIPFFDTQTYADISWSSYWDSRLETNNKVVFREFIAKVFGNYVSQKVPWQRSSYTRLLRNVRFELQKR